MAHPLDIPVTLGSSQAGLELQARKHDGTVLASTYDEEGAGAYTLHLSAVPDGYRGAVQVWGRLAGSGAAWVLKASTAVNPEESENADVRTSTRAAPADIPAPPDLSRLDVTVSSRVATADARLGHLDADVSSRAATADARFAHLDADVSSRLAAAGYTAPDNADVQAILAAVDDAVHGLAAILAAVDTRAATADPRLAHLDADVSSRADSAAYTAARAALLDHLVRDVPDVSALATEANVDVLLARLTAARAAALDHLDVDVSSRLAAAGYTPPDNADVAAALAQLVDASHGLAAILAAVESRAAPADLAALDAPVSSRAAAADYTAGRAALLDRLDAAVSSRLAAAAYAAPLDVLQTAAAVWDALTAEHSVPGSTGAALQASGGAADPLANPVPAAYAPGTAGAALARLIGGPLTIVSALDRQAALTLVAGDDYLFGDGRQIDIPRVEGDAWPADLTGWTLTFAARDLRGGMAEVTGGTVSSPNPSGPAQSVRVELPGAVTSLLEAPEGSTPAWVYGVEAARAGRRVTLRYGQLRLAAAP